jgi:hypothetical protein
MKPKSVTVFCAMLCGGALGAALPVWAADTTVTALNTQVRQTDTLVTRLGAVPVETRMVGEFTTFAGSEQNAQSLVTGLRSSTPITLTSQTATSPTTTSLTFDPPTRPMGYGNVFISLALAKQQLASYGITDPTPQEIQAALTGGTITTGSGTTAQTVTLRGILNQRADGMGWGVIAQSQGVKLGAVISGLKSANQQVVATTTVNSSSTSASGTQTTATTTTTTTASGKMSNARARGTFGGDTSGIVTAAGNGVGVRAGGTVNAGTRAPGAGIVTGGGAAVRGAGNAQGLVKGHFKD